MENEQLIDRARELRKSIKLEFEERNRHSLTQTTVGKTELKHLVAETLAIELGAELAEGGWDFVNPDDPRIQLARQATEEVFAGELPTSGVE